LKLKLGKWSVALAVSFILGGCTAPPEDLSNDELVNISSVEQLIDDVIGFREAEIEYRPYLTFPSDKDILKPALYLRNYCSYLGGKINQAKLGMPRLEQTNTEFGSDGKGYVFDDIVSSFGRFECENEKSGFIVDITHGESSYVDDSARKTKVTITPVTNEQLESEVIRRKLVNQANLKRIAERKAKLQVQLNEAKNLFVDGQRTVLNVGQKVCSIKNQMGYVEQVSGNKIKILQLGRATSKHEFALFYKGDVFLDDTKQIYMWDDKRNWSKCDFREL